MMAEQQRLMEEQMAKEFEAALAAQAEEEAAK